VKLLCIKSLEPYWGVTFKKGEWYDVVRVGKYTSNLIIDEDNYWKYSRLVILSKDYPDYKQEDMWKVIPDYLTLTQISEKFCKKVEYPTYEVRGENVGIREVNTYCAIKREDFKKMWGSDKFDTSVFFVDDYFQTIEDVRENKLNILEI
jgi:hypothetical protein